MEELNQEVEDIEDLQLTQVYDNSIELESPYALRPKQAFTFTIEDIMINKRADIDFFEFKSVEAAFDEDYKVEENEDYIAVTADAISGVAPRQEGEYSFDAKLKYTSFRQGGESKIINTEFTLFVGEKYNQKQSPLLTYAFYGLIALGITSFLTILFVCTKRIRNKRMIEFEEFEDNELGHKQVVRGGSELENTADNSA